MYTVQKQITWIREAIESWWFVLDSTPANRATVTLHAPHRHYSTAWLPA